MLKRNVYKFLLYNNFFGLNHATSENSGYVCSNRIDFIDKILIDHTVKKFDDYLQNIDLNDELHVLKPINNSNYTLLDRNPHKEILCIDIKN